MTWIPDLSREAYVIGAPFVRAVGWLSREHRFPTGAVPLAFVDRLAEVARRAEASELAYQLGQFMGFHDCDLCPPEATRVGNTIRNFGARNFCVPFAHLLFVCPELVAHYVRDHDYRPPDEFIAAVIETPLPKERRYGRIAATFCARLATLGALDGAIISALSERWTVKGQCVGCGLWTYGHDAASSTCCGAAVVNVETRTINLPPPVIVLVMGESATAQTVGQQLAQRNVWSFRDADDFQSLANVAKMRRGEALTDADCAPWLEDLRALCTYTIAAGQSLVLTCRALEAASRRVLTEGVPGVQVFTFGVSGDKGDPFANIRHLDDAIVIESVAASESIVAMIVDQLALNGVRGMA